MKNITTTLLLIPGGEELSLPDNAGKLRSAMRIALTDHTAQIIMLSDESLIPEEVLHTMAKYKNVLLVESDDITSEDDAWRIALDMQSENYLPVVLNAGFDFQVVEMEQVAVKYEDFEIVDKYV